MVAGGGKTTTIVSIILGAVRHDVPVVITALSNHAIEAVAATAADLTWRRPIVAVVNPHNPKVGSHTARLTPQAQVDAAIANDLVVFTNTFELMMHMLWK